MQMSSPLRERPTVIPLPPHASVWAETGHESGPVSRTPSPPSSPLHAARLGCSEAQHGCMQAC